MSLTATGTQVAWHDPGAAEEAKCCCGECCSAEVLAALAPLSASGGLVGEATPMTQDVGACFFRGSSGFLCDGSYVVNYEIYLERIDGECKWVFRAWFQPFLSGVYLDRDGSCDGPILLNILIWATWVKDFDAGNPAGVYTFVAQSYNATAAGDDIPIDLDLVPVSDYLDCSDSRYITHGWNDWCGSNPFDSANIIVA